MNSLKCELCGDNHLIKKDGFFECESCVTRYTLEDAKKLFVSGIVSIEGDVKVQQTDFVIRAGVLEKYNGSDVEAIIPDNVVAIGEEAFKDCIGLKKVQIPQSVTRIRKAAFQGCFDLIEVNIPTKIESIGELAFERCFSIKSLSLPSTLKSIGRYAFVNCRSINSIEIPNSI